MYIRSVLGLLHLSTESSNHRFWKILCLNDFLLLLIEISTWQMKTMDFRIFVKKCYTKRCTSSYSARSLSSCFHAAPNDFVSAIPLGIIRYNYVASGSEIRCMYFSEASYQVFTSTSSSLWFYSSNLLPKALHAAGEIVRVKNTSSRAIANLSLIWQGEKRLAWVSKSLFNRRRIRFWIHLVVSRPLLNCGSCCISSFLSRAWS